MTIPGRLFKYQSCSMTSICNLKKRVLYFSPAADFNDPFDCKYHIEDFSKKDLLKVVGDMAASGYAVPSSLDDSEQQENARLELTAHVGKTIREAFESKGVACFSSRQDSLLMWGYYADGHRGFCLEFDAGREPFAKAKRVSYQEDFPSVSPIDFVSGESDTSGVFERMMCTKSADWQHEDEWRLVHDRQGQEYCYGADALKAVYFGARMDFVQKEILSLVVRGSGTKLFEMEFAESRYAVEAKEVEYLPHPQAGGGDS